jgi:hypothetical protein
MRHRDLARRLGPALALALVMAPAAAPAQVSPTAPVHPTMPWGGITTPYGQFIRFVYMPPQPVTLVYLVVGAPPQLEPTPPSGGESKPEEAPPPGDAAREGAPPTPQVVSQQVTVPGFYVRETTMGFHYPERWAIEQAAPNVYRWRVLPAQFVPR